jgi:2-haloacid dehalogenase
MDDTIFDFHKAETFALSQTLSAFGVSAQPDEYLEPFGEINRRVWTDYEHGRATQEEIRVRRFVLLLEHLGVDGDAHRISDGYVQNLGEATFMVDGAQEFLDAVMSRMPVGVVSNGLSAVQRSRLQKTGLEPRFHAILISEEIGIQKPDPRIFHEAAERLGVPADSGVLMVGDNLNSDIRGALDAGLHACWFNIRNREPDPEVTPTFTVYSLAELLGRLQQATAS